MRFRLRPCGVVGEDEVDLEGSDVYLLVLEGEPFYTEFLRWVLEGNGVLSPSEISAFSIGNKVIVFGEGDLQADGRRGVLVRGRVRELFYGVLVLNYELSKLVLRLYEECSSGGREDGD